MLELHFKTEDPRLIEQAKAYWAMDVEGKWVASSVDKLASQFGCSSWSLQKSVMDACDAHIMSAACSRCHKPLIATSRTAYTRASSSLRSMGEKKASWHWCGVCAAEHSQERRRAAVEKAESERRETLATMARERRMVDEWLVDASTCSPKAYDEMSAREAFLLCAVVEMCPPSNVSGTLDRWQHHRTRLFAHIEHTLDVYRELHRLGWIAPNFESPSGSVFVNAAGEVDYRVDAVSWSIASDINGATYEDLAAYIHRRLDEAKSSGELVELWYAVSMSEVRADFERLNNKPRFRLYRGDWTARLESNMRQLLRRTSLGHARKMMWHGLQRIGNMVLEAELPRWKIDTFVPNIFLRTLTDHQARGYAPSTWRRDPVTEEAALSALLFEYLLDGRAEFYEVLNGTQIERLFSRAVDGRLHELLIE